MGHREADLSPVAEDGPPDDDDAAAEAAAASAEESAPTAEATPDATAEAAAGRRAGLFGSLAVRSGYATEDEVLEALRLQERAKTILGRVLLLGEILWLTGRIDDRQLSDLVAERPEQQDRIERTLEEPKFGEVALNLEYCTPEQLFDALSEQRRLVEAGGRYRLLGEVLISKGYLDMEQVDTIVSNLLAYAEHAAEEREAR